MLRFITPIFIFFICSTATAQNLYTARGYWEESNKLTFKTIKEKELKGDSLTLEEKNYITDYEQYLFNYYQRLSLEEKERYAAMVEVWDKEKSTLSVPKEERPGEPEEEELFEWRRRDRWVNGLCGIYYGATLIDATNADGATAAAIPIITGGVWILGPVINPRKYQGITTATMRASNTGKILGIGYGAALATAIMGEETDGTFAAVTSTIGSIGLGEYAFQWQKKNKINEGHVEIIKHYALVGTWLGVSAPLALQSSSPNVFGASVLSGGILGIGLGHRAGKRYDFTRGDVDAINSFTLITTGLGFTFVIESLENSDANESLILIPAASSLAGSLLSQKAVKNVRLTKRQGSTINLACAGSALVTLGVLTAAESSSPTAWIGFPTGVALLTHQLLFAKYKKDNLSFKSQRRSKNNFHLSMNVTPENYWINRQSTAKSGAFNQSAGANSILKIKMTF